MKKLPGKRGPTQAAIQRLKKVNEPGDGHGEESQDQLQTRMRGATLAGTERWVP
jgi:hypothetical protein